MLRVASEAAARDETSETNREASAALNILAAFGRHRIICLDADGAGAERHRELRLHDVLTSLRNECLMHLDVVHVTSPDQKRVRRIGCALIAMAAAAHRETQIIFPREGYRRRDIVGVAGRDRVHARLGGPRIDPSGGLGESRRIAEEIRILEVLE